MNRCSDDRLAHRENSNYGNMAVTNHRMPGFGLQVVQAIMVERYLGKGIEKRPRSPAALDVGLFAASLNLPDNRTDKTAATAAAADWRGLGLTAVCRHGFKAAVVAVDGVCVCDDHQPEMV